MAKFFFQILLLRTEMSFYFMVLENKHEKDDYEELYMLILILFVEIPGIII
jgi:hypothetical protein